VFDLKAKPEAALKLAGDWRIVSYGVPGAEWAVLPQAPAWLKLAANGGLTGSAGCGSLSGRYALAHGLLRATQLNTAPKSCSEAVARQAVRLTRALSSAVSASVTGQALRIETEDGLIIRAQKGAARASAAPGFVGMTWRLQAAVARSETLDLAQELNFDLGFEVDGRLHARAACGAADGAYKAQGKQLTLRPPAMPEAGCAPEIARQQQAVLRALASVTSFTLANGQLMLTGDRSRTTLRFAPPSPGTLANTRWRLAWLFVAGVQISVPDGAGMSLSFDDRGAVGGLAGCNNFMGGYRATGQALAFADVQATSLSCSDEMARLESAYLDALRGVAAYRATGDQLELCDAVGKAQLGFQRAAP
jgi:heat shock protein HslJ